MDQRDTIFALSSGSPPAGIGVIRISGPAAGSALTALTGGLPDPRRARHAAVRDGDGAILDHALCLWFPGPHSVTGDDVAELHVHGGRAIVAAVLATLGARPGLRPAAAGEFTRRSLENGRLDLTEAEGLADLLAAETESQRRNAVAMAGGALTRLVEGWRRRILAASALVEAALDFADEDDVVPVHDDPDIAAIAGEVRATLATPPVERLRDGIRVAIAGPPNAGKSTLLNALIGREAAITSAIPGTTRDVIEAPVSIGGIAFLLTDTAGLRATDDPLEQMGIARAERAMAQADILVWLGDGPAPHPEAISLFARSDLRGDGPDDRLAISSVTGAGLTELASELIARAARLLPRDDEVALNRRQRDVIADVLTGLDLARSERDLLLVGEGLRLARAALDRVTGRVGIEDVLDTLFGRFCIGK